MGVSSICVYLCSTAIVALPLNVSLSVCVCNSETTEKYRMDEREKQLVRKTKHRSTCMKEEDIHVERNREWITMTNLTVIVYTYIKLSSEFVLWAALSLFVLYVNLALLAGKLWIKPLNTTTTYYTKENNYNWSLNSAYKLLQYYYLVVRDRPVYTDGCCDDGSAANALRHWTHDCIA